MKWVVFACLSRCTPCSIFMPCREFLPCSNRTVRDKGGSRGGLIVSALVPGASGPGSSPGRGHCVVFLDKTLNSHSASLHTGVSMGTGKLLGKPNKLRGMTCNGLASRPGGGRNTPSRFMLPEPAIGSGSCEPVGSEASFQETKATLQKILTPLLENFPQF